MRINIKRNSILYLVYYVEIRIMNNNNKTHFSWVNTNIFITSAK